MDLRCNVGEGCLESKEHTLWWIRQMILEIHHDYAMNEIDETTLEKSFKLKSYLEKYLKYYDEIDDNNDE